ncbi:MAG TPA: methyltransferase domain-containing protein [Myxococcota bacterium]|nr:methyltransferase domain-containing protein [Myxococcota bacterium]
MSDEEEIRHAYDGSSPAFRALEAWGWGEFVNLGFYPWLALPQLAFGMAPFQRRLVERALDLLAPAPAERVLDAGCGRGGTTARIAARGASALGLDLLPENVAEARKRFGGAPGPRFDVADVTRLPARAGGADLAPGSFDAVLCLEAAFHFGAAGRREFLAEAWRVLRPGGRLVLVDFVWRDADPARIASLDPDRHVRGTWRFDEFEPLERYRANARSLGFAEAALRDWTRPVTDTFQHVAAALARAGTIPPVRLALGWLRPGLRKIRPDEWRFLVELMRAHDRVRKASRYVAFRFEKPA